MSENKIIIVVVLAAIATASLFGYLLYLEDEHRVQCIEYAGTPHYVILHNQLYCEHVDGNYIKLRVGNK